MLGEEYVVHTGINIILMEIYKNVRKGEDGQDEDGKGGEVGCKEVGFGVGNDDLSNESPYHNEGTWYLNRCANILPGTNLTILRIVIVS